MSLPLLSERCFARQPASDRHRTLAWRNSAPPSKSRATRSAETTVTPTIDDMTCTPCASRVEKAQSRVPGVVRAEGNLATKPASVTLATRHVDETGILAAAKHADHVARPRHAEFGADA